MQVVAHSWLITNIGSLALNRQHKVIQSRFAPASWHLQSPRESQLAGPLQQSCCLVAAQQGFHPRRLSLAAVVASAGQEGLEQFETITALRAGTREDIEQKIILTACRSESLFPNKCLATWNIKVIIMSLVPPLSSVMEALVLKTLVIS